MFKKHDETDKTEFYINMFFLLRFNYQSLKSITQWILSHNILVRSWLYEITNYFYVFSNFFTMIWVMRRNRVESGFTPHVSTRIRLEPY